MSSHDAPLIFRRRAKFFWFIGGVILGSLLTATSGYVFAHTWVLFRPICEIGKHEPKTFIESVLTRPYRIIDGPMRIDFRVQALRAITTALRLTNNDHSYVTIDYYLDLQSYWNFTNKAIRSLFRYRTSISRDFAWERNRSIHDDTYPHLAVSARERLELAQLDPMDIDGPLSCDLVRYFAIEGAPLPKPAD